MGFFLPFNINWCLRRFMCGFIMEVYLCFVVEIYLVLGESHLIYQRAVFVKIFIIENLQVFDCESLLCFNVKILLLFYWSDSPVFYYEELFVFIAKIYLCFILGWCL